MARDDARGGEPMLCESCGYPLDGLPSTAVCPECAREVSASVPERRGGSPWQRGPGVGAWFKGARLMLGQPGRSWDLVRIEGPRSAALLATNILVSAVLTAASICPGVAWRISVLALAALTAVIAVVLAGLSSVEYVGIRVLGGRRGFRITSCVALTICAHASYGWVLGGAAVCITGQALQRVPSLWDASMGVGQGFNRGVLLAAGVGTLVFVAGMTAFSILCGVGYRALRYANRGPSRYHVGA